MIYPYMTGFNLGRTILFIVMLFLNTLILIFASWNIGVTGALPAPVFLLINSCLILVFIPVSYSEFVSHHAPNITIFWELLFTAIWSALELGAAVAVTVTLPASCAGSYSLCASSALLVPVSWMSMVYFLAYFLILIFLSLSHRSVYPNVWYIPVTDMAWFGHPDKHQDLFKFTGPPRLWPRAPSASSQHAPSMKAHSYAPSARTHYTSDNRSTQSRPLWSRPFGSRNRGIDEPFPTLAAPPFVRTRHRIAVGIRERLGLPPPETGADIAAREFIQKYRYAGREARGMLPLTPVDPELGLSMHDLPTS